MQTRSTLLLVCRHLMYVLAIHIVISTCNLVMFLVLVDQDVLPPPAHQDVLPPPADQNVLPPPAHQDVLPPPADQDVLPPAADQDVLPIRTCSLEPPRSVLMVTRVWRVVHVTCCMAVGDKYSCYPETHAVCCPDKIHCCPEDYSCTDEKCVLGKSLHPLLDLKVREQEPPVLDMKCPDEKSVCPDKYTCCINGADSYGCCPKQNAVCCADMKLLVIIVTLLVDNVLAVAHTTHS